MDLDDELVDDEEEGEEEPELSGEVEAKSASEPE